MTKDETVYPVVESDPALEELARSAPLMEAAQAALIAVQRALEPAKEWRASQLWTTVQEARDLLAQGEFDAWYDPTKPEDFRHWRENYADRSDTSL
jgi:hypothetical protein